MSGFEVKERNVYPPQTYLFQETGLDFCLVSQKAEPRFEIRFLVSKIVV